MSGRVHEEATRRGRILLGTFFLCCQSNLRGLDADALDRYAEGLAFYYLAAEPPADWDGVFTMQNK